MRARPRLRTVEKYSPPYRLNEFPVGFHVGVAKQIVYLRATQPNPTVEGEEWERIFADAIGAEWHPSNVGLDDVVLGSSAWGAKTVKNNAPSTAGRVRLISGRNSPAYSYDETDLAADAEKIGASVLEIWNERVAAVRNRFRHLRTVVLVKKPDLSEFSVFEFETVMYDPDGIRWCRNARGNLEGFDLGTDEHWFTWQPHGSQFTIIEEVPASRLAFRIKEPCPPDMEAVLCSLGFDETWVELLP